MFWFIYELFGSVGCSAVFKNNNIRVRLSEMLMFTTDLTAINLTLKEIMPKRVKQSEQSIHTAEPEWKLTARQLCGNM